MRRRRATHALVVATIVGVVTYWLIRPTQFDDSSPPACSNAMDVGVSCSEPRAALVAIAAAALAFVVFYLAAWTRSRMPIRSRRQDGPRRQQADAGDRQH